MGWKHNFSKAFGLGALKKILRKVYGVSFKWQNFVGYFSIAHCILNKEFIFEGVEIWFKWYFGMNTKYLHVPLWRREEDESFTASKLLLGRRGFFQFDCGLIRKKKASDICWGLTNLRIFFISSNCHRI